VNKTFEELDKIHQFAKTWVNSPLNLTALLGDLQNTNNIKVKQNLNQSFLNSKIIFRKFYPIIYFKNYSVVLLE